MKIENISLPERSGLIVCGEDVSIEQAMEILIRTNDWYSWTNDPEWFQIICNLTGMRDRALGPRSTPAQCSTTWGATSFLDEDSLAQFKLEMKVLDLVSLSNKQIASNCIYGPFGWCNWNGNIGCNSYNVQYPSVQEIIEEWTVIAKTFPYLNLWSQLYSDEYGIEGIKPVIEFHIKNGKVSIQEPTKCHPFLEPNYNIFCKNAERGCSAEKLKEALTYCKRNS